MHVLRPKATSASFSAPFVNSGCSVGQFRCVSPKSVCGFDAPHSEHAIAAATEGFSSTDFEVLSLIT